MAFSPKVVNLDGLRIILVKDNRESVMVQAYVGTGSREETDKVAGAAHFLEHFVFKGTKKFPGMFEIPKAVEEVGGVYNAFTDSANMGFWVKMAKEKLLLAVRIVGQMVSEPVLPEKHFDKERGTILEELKMYDDRPDTKAMEEQWKLLFGKTNLGRLTIGTVESLKAMKVSDLRDYMDRWFVPDNMIIGIVGNFGDEEKLLSEIRKEFAPILWRKKKAPPKDIFAWGKKEGRAKLFSRKIEQANLSIGLPALPLTDPLRYAMFLTNIILGGGSTSRLFKEVREKRGWAYSIGSGTDSFVDAGALLIGGGLPKEKLADAVELIMDIVAGLGGQGKWGITAKELAVAKETYKGRLSLAYDVPEKVMGYALSELMFEGKIYIPEEHKALADKVTLEEVREFCKTFLLPEKMAIAVVGDYEELPFSV